MTNDDQMTTKLSDDASQTETIEFDPGMMAVDEAEFGEGLNSLDLQGGAPAVSQPAREMASDGEPGPGLLSRLLRTVARWCGAR